VADCFRWLANAVRARTWGRKAFTPLRAVVSEGSWPGGFVFHPGGRYLITKNVVDGKFRDASNTVWDLVAEWSFPFPGGVTAVPAAAWSPDGRDLAVGGSEGDVVVARFPGGEAATRIRFPGLPRSTSATTGGISPFPALKVPTWSDSSTYQRAVTSGSLWSTTTPCSARPSARMAGCS